MCLRIWEARNRKLAQLSRIRTATNACHELCWTLNPRGLTPLLWVQTRELWSKNEKYFDCCCVNEDFTRGTLTLPADKDRLYRDNVFPFAGRRQVSRKKNHRYEIYRYVCTRTVRANGKKIFNQKIRSRVFFRSTFFFFWKLKLVFAMNSLIFKHIFAAKHEMFNYGICK